MYPLKLFENTINKQNVTFNGYNITTGVADFNNTKIHLSLQILFILFHKIHRKMICIMMILFRTIKIKWVLD